MYIRNYKTHWKDGLSAPRDRRNIIKIARFIANSKDIPEKNKRDFINLLIWQITEINGKYNIRFVSRGVISRGNPIIHEHVFTRKHLIDQILKNPNKTEEIFNKAIACLITREEDRRLPKPNLKVEGWKRYRYARIRVYDRHKNKWRS